MIRMIRRWLTVDRQVWDDNDHTHDDDVDDGGDDGDNGDDDDGQGDCGDHDDCDDDGDGQLGAKVEGCLLTLYCLCLQVL